jgi:CSLREA domain-containing protein
MTQAIVAKRTARTERPRKALLGACLMVVAAGMAAYLMLAANSAAHAATIFTVNLTADTPDANLSDAVCDVNPTASDNQCTLRAAIQEANQRTDDLADTINFNIPTSGVATISPASALPTINGPVTIDGYSQPDSSPNTLEVGDNAVLKVELDGTKVPDASGLNIAPNSSGSVIRGLVINRFRTGIEVDGVSSVANRIEGNFIGTDPSGTLVRSNDGAGVTLDGLNAIVGGATPTSRNLISGNLNQGVRLFDSGARVQGNLIGTEKDGATALDGGFFTGNLGGLLVPGSNNVIGGSGPGEANTIAFNVGEAGVLVQSSGTGNRILGNSIFSNGRLGIDLDGGTQNFAGVTKNDTKDPDTGSNNLQNSPRLTSATTSDDRITMEGNLNSTPEKTFVLRFFSNPPGGEEGKTFVGRKSVTTNANGNAPFTFSFAKTVSAGRTVTATATGPGGNTSEFSAPRTVAAP